MMTDNPGLDEDRYMTAAPLSFLPPESEGSSNLNPQQQLPHPRGSSSPALGYLVSGDLVQESGSDVSLLQSSIDRAQQLVSQGFDNGLPGLASGPRRNTSTSVTLGSVSNSSRLNDLQSNEVDDQETSNTAMGEKSTSAVDRPSSSSGAEMDQSIREPLNVSPADLDRCDPLLTFGGELVSSGPVGDDEMDDQQQHTSADSMEATGVDEVNRRSIFVGNVDYGSTPPDLQEHFKACGTINRITIMVDRYTGHPKGFAYIEFQDEDAVASAMALHESVLRGRPLKVTPKRKNIPGLRSTNSMVRRGGSSFSAGRGRGAPSQMVPRNTAPSRFSRRGACRMAIAGYNPSYRGRSGRGAAPY